MSIFTFHLAKIPVFAAIKFLIFPPKPSNNKGLIHGEIMNAMKLGAPIFSTSRMLLRQVVYFAQWEDDAAIDAFLLHNPLGQYLAKGWYTRLHFLRQWGTIEAFKIPLTTDDISSDPEAPVVAVTIARMKLLQVPRFIHWGRPVEKLVRDHPDITYATAAIRYPRTVSTFSIWNTQTAMTDMVRGHSAVPQPKRHADAMNERNRKDFHFEFTTLRFSAIAEYGSWEGRSNLIPILKNKI